MNAVTIYNPITEMHTKVGERFIETVEELLKKQLEVKSYSVDDDSYYARESIKIIINDHTTLSIMMDTRK